MDIDIKPAEVFTITLTCKVNNLDKSLFKNNEEQDLRVRGVKTPQGGLLSKF